MAALASTLTSQLRLQCSLDVDLTAQLKDAKVKHDQRLQQAAIMAAAAHARRDADVPPTQGEARRWLRSGRYSRKVRHTIGQLTEVAPPVHTIGWVSSITDRIDVLRVNVQFVRSIEAHIIS